MTTTVEFTADEILSLAIYFDCPVRGRPRVPRHVIDAVTKLRAAAAEIRLERRRAVADGTEAP